MKKILVVEDSAAVRSLVRAILEDPAFADAHGGCEVAEATCGFDAMRLLPRGRYDLIITDINMPDINGLELINFVKKNPNYRDTPLFIVSTESSETDRKRGLALGAVEYLVKPFEPDVLTSLVRRHMKLG